MGHHSVLLEKSTGRVLTFGAAALGLWSNALWLFHRLSQFARGFHTGARGTSTGCGGIDGGDVDWDRLLQYVRDVSRRTGVLLRGESVSAVWARTYQHPCADAAYIGTRWEAHSSRPRAVTVTPSLGPSRGTFILDGLIRGWSARRRCRRWTTASGGNAGGCAQR